MMLGLFFIVPPLLFYGLVVCLPAGRPAWIGIGVAALVLGLIWIGYPFGAGPLWTGVERADAIMLFVAVICTIGWLAASLTQTLGRWIVARLPALSYPAVAILVLVATAVPLIFRLAI